MSEADLKDEIFLNDLSTVERIFVENLCELADINPSDADKDLTAFRAALSSSEMMAAHSFQSLAASEGNVSDIASQSDQWDEAIRGPKMSNPTGHTIFKYQMPVAEQFEMKLPEGAQIIRMDGENGLLWLWAVVDRDKPDETRKFRAFKTGGSGMERGMELIYRGCAAIYIQAELMLYIFEEIEP